MIKNFELTEDFVRIEKSAKDWKEAIIMSSKALLDADLVEQSYIDAMITSVEEHGPYIVIAPNVAMPHARPEAGSKNVGFAVMKLDEPVYFTEDESTYASLFIALSCVDSDTHLEMMQQIVMILSDSEKYDRLVATQSKEEILKIFSV